MSKSYLILIIIILLFQNCKNSNNKLKQVYYEDGIIKEEYNCIHDSILDGSYNSYFKNGNIKETGNYMQNKKIGKWYSYYDNGKIFGNYSYDTTGQILGVQTEFYENGNIQRYMFVNYDELMVFERKYDINGLVKSTFGNYLTMIVSDFHRIYKLGDTLDYEFHIATPTDCIISFYSSLDSESDTTIIWKKNIIRDNTFHYFKELSDSGDYVLNIKLIAVDSVLGKTTVEARYMKFSVVMDKDYKNQPLKVPYEVPKKIILHN